MAATSGSRTAYPSGVHRRFLSGVRVTRSLILCVCFVCPFVLFFGHVLLRFTDYGYLFGIFKLFFQTVLIWCTSFIGLDPLCPYYDTMYLTEWHLGNVINTGNTTIRLYMSSVKYLCIVVSNSTWLWAPRWVSYKKEKTLSNFREHMA